MTQRNPLKPASYESIQVTEMLRLQKDLKVRNNILDASLKVKYKILTLSTKSQLQVTIFSHSISLLPFKFSAKHFCCCCLVTHSLISYVS